MKFVVPLLACAAAAAFAAEPAAPGVPNFHRVNEHLYRGGQPSQAGFSSLAALGVKLVLDLRPPGEHPVAVEERAVEAAGMRYLNLPMKGIGAPTEAEVAHALAVLGDQANGVVFVHCRRGSDRTGTVIACYRMTHDHWENRRALEEAKSFGLSWAERGMAHYILRFHPAGEPAAAGSR